MRHLLKLSLPALGASLLLAACGSSSNSHTASSSSSVQPAPQTTGSASAIVKTSSSSLGTVLVDAQGMTLYHLSGEQNGKFICATTACTTIRHPLTVASSSTPRGEVGGLGTVRRPDGSLQVTYAGSPLYTFAQDRQPHETNGQGIKDVGVWTAVAASSAGATPGTSTQGTTAPSGEGGGRAY